MAGMTEEQGPNIRVLKRVVIALGVLIVISLAVVVWGVARNASKLVAGDPAVPTAEPRGGFGDVTVDAPSGSRLVGVSAAGERGLLRLRLRDGSEKVVIVDLGTGKVLGTLVVAPGPLVQE